MNTNAINEQEINEVFSGLLELAIRDQKAIEKAIQKMEAISNELYRTAKDLPVRVEHQFSRSMSEAANDAANTIVERFERANRAAEIATEAYLEAARFSVWRIMLVAFGITVVAVVALVTAAWCFTPSFDEIKARRAEVEQLRNTAEIFVKNGGRLDVQYCRIPNGSLQVCARIDPKTKTNLNGGYYVIPNK